MHRHPGAVTARAALRAGLIAGAVSGAPSTAYSLLAGSDLLAPIRAAATIVYAHALPGPWPLIAGVGVHFAVSTLWAAVVLALPHAPWVMGRLPRERRIALATAAGAAIGAFDLLVVAPLFFQAVSRLPFWPQMADHALWGAAVGWTAAFGTTRAARCSHAPEESASESVRTPRVSR